MSMDLTGITNRNEYYTNHYFSSIFEENAADTISAWRAAAKASDEIRTPWALLRDAARQYYPVHDRFLRSKFDTQTLANIRDMADVYLSALGYPVAAPDWVVIDDTLHVPVYLELKKPSGAPALWVLLATSEDKEAAILDKFCFSAVDFGEEGLSAVPEEVLTPIPNEDLVTKILFGQAEPPRFVILIGMNQIALIDRNKWNEKRYLQFELEEIFSRHEETTLQAMAVLLHRDSLCPEEGAALLDELDANSQKHAAGVSQDLKYALRESIELLGNEVLFDMAHRQLRDLDADPVDAGQLTLECLRYMYRMLFVLFIEARPELGYAPIKAQSYLSGYSLESLRDIADDIRDDVEEVGGGYYLHETLSKLYDLIYRGYPGTEEEVLKYSGAESLHDMFVIAPLKAHIFDPEFTPMLTQAKLRNSVMLRIIDLMSMTRATGRRNDRRGRISYANLGINQMGSVYEALLSYRGFIAEHTLFEVKRAGDKFNELDVGYFVAESELDQYTEDERVRYEHDDPDGRYKKNDLRKYEKGTFIYRLAGREREKSASYYTPEVLTKCLVKYALKELLEGKTADEILHLTVCEPAMGSAAFLNETINQLAEAYLDRRQTERGEMIPAESRLRELQKVKMYIADRNVYGIDLNPVAVELAEVSLWLNTIYEGGLVPWFGTQLVCGNSLIGARRQCYHVSNLQATSKGLRWFELAPDRVRMTDKRKPKTQVYHFLLGDPGMCSYNDRVIKSLEPENIKAMNKWKKEFTKPYSEDDVATLLRLSALIDDLWAAQVRLRQEVEAKTQDNLSVYGWEDNAEDSHTTIRQKDRILSELYKSEHMRNAGPYARLKFAMDYWCALWFWPIEQAELLPSRSEFLFEMNLILEGTVSSIDVHAGQMSMFEATEMEQIAMDIVETYGLDTVVDIPALRRNNPRLDLAAKIAEQNRFMHWELEFADLFAERGGFDLVIGNPPWIKTEWKEQAVIGDSQPLFVIRALSSTQTNNLRKVALENELTKSEYYIEYTSIAGQQAFLNSLENYPLLVGMKANLYKCFLPTAWMYASPIGISGFLHQEGVYDDPKGGTLRRQLYPRLRKHFQFENELRLFEGTNDHGKMKFSLNIYGAPKRSVAFESICNLFTPLTIEECYAKDNNSHVIPGIKDDDGNWNIMGHPKRVVHIGQKELTTISMLFDPQSDWTTTILPQIHAEAFIKTLSCFLDSNKTVGMLSEAEVYTTQFWNETASQDDGTIDARLGFPTSPQEAVFSSAQIGVANPFFQTTRRAYYSNNDYDRVDLSEIPNDYLPRNRYQPGCAWETYRDRIPITPWGTKVSDEYHLMIRRRVGTGSERTLTCAIAACGFTHVNTVISVSLSNSVDMVTLAGSLSSIPCDFVIKCLGRSDIYFSSLNCLPLISGAVQSEIVVRTLLLNCLTKPYAQLWERLWKEEYTQFTWTKNDMRLKCDRFQKLTKGWNSSVPLKTEFERRQALIEIDVLVAMALGMTLEELIAIYQVQFPLLRKSEANTWYDTQGKIAFSTSGIQTGIGYDRTEWEQNLKGSPAGQKFYRTITDDTMPGGPVERTIEYVAPFDRCDREQDYETAWKFFEEKYGTGE